MSEWKSALRILAEQPKFSLSFTELEQELITRRALGFGVEAKHVVQWLERENLVEYDQVLDEVFLKVSNVINRFLVQQTPILGSIKSELTQEQDLRLDYSQSPVSKEKLEEIGDRIDKLSKKR